MIEKGDFLFLVTAHASHTDSSSSLTEISERRQQLGGEGRAGCLEQDERGASGTYHHQAAPYCRTKCSDTGQKLQNPNRAGNQGRRHGWDDYSHRPLFRIHTQDGPVVLFHSYCFLMCLTEKTSEIVARFD